MYTQPPGHPFLNFIRAVEQSGMSQKAMDLFSEPSALKNCNRYRIVTPRATHNWRSYLDSPLRFSLKTQSIFLCVIVDRRRYHRDTNYKNISLLLLRFSSFFCHFFYTPKNCPRSFIQRTMQFRSSIIVIGKKSLGIRSRLAPRTTGAIARNE